MRLRRLRIGGFNGAGELRLTFEQEQLDDPAIAFFVGPNGAGKSRVLEAVGRIFSHLAAGVPPGIDFDIEYELGDRRILIMTQPPALASVPDVTPHRLARIDGWLLISKGQFYEWRLEHIQDRWPADVDAILPYRVVGLSTGPTTRLDWALRRSLFDTLAQRLEPAAAESPPADMPLKEWEAYVESERQTLETEVRRATEHSRCVALSGNELVLALLALLSHPDTATDPDEVRDEVMGRAGIDTQRSLRAFTINVAANWRDLLQEQHHAAFERLLAQAVRRVAITSANQNPDFDAPDERVVYEVGPRLRAWISSDAGTPLVWFDQLMLWLRTEAITSVRLVMNQLSENGLLLNEDFSDGEFLLAGRYAMLFLLQGHTDCLVLFDEPETHFNDRWKVELIYDVKRTLEGNAGQVLIATHSSLTLTDADRSNVYVFDIDADADVEPQRPPVSPLAASLEDITSHVFGAKRSTGRAVETLIERALGSEDLEVLRAALDRVGPGYHKFRLQYAVRQLLDAP